MNHKAIIAGAGLLLMTSCASVSSNSTDYASNAGAAIPELKFSQALYNWQRIDDGSVVIWLRPGQAYLLTFRNQCSATRTAKAVVVGSMDGMPGRITAGSSDLVVGPMRCRIETIQPINKG